jgi:branched-chain amino acid transport system ATP-binding protein
LYGVLELLRESGLAILLIEQNAQLAFESCSRGYVLQHGRVVLEGTVDELRATDLVHKIYLGVEWLTSETAATTVGDNAREGEEE